MPPQPVPGISGIGFPSWCSLDYAFVIHYFLWYLFEEKFSYINIYIYIYCLTLKKIIFDVFNLEKN